jgi:squalene-associated FAD-dependent desaturase
MKLMRMRAADDANGPTVLAWLQSNGQSPAAIAGFWNVVLVSALGETLDRASLFAARKVIVYGFLGAANAYQVDVPQVPLGELYGGRLADCLRKRGVELRTGAAVRSVTFDGRPLLELAGGETIRPDFVVLAVPWSKVTEIVDSSISTKWSWLSAMSSVPSAPITGVHLWFDQPIMELPHAVLVGRLSQWIFNRGWRLSDDGAAGHYYQVVISASYALADRPRDQIAAEVQNELAAVWPDAASARLLRARVVTEHGAVFSPRPGVESLRPSQQTSCERIYLAGDWTNTGWPATMESAVRSGVAAARALGRARGPQDSNDTAGMRSRRSRLTDDDGGNATKNNASASSMASPSGRIERAGEVETAEEALA